MTANIEPGGLHIMFLGLKRPLEKGERFKATLVFEKAGPIEVEFVVEAMGAGEHRHTN
jgi:copper(I)-binding protein